MTILGAELVVRQARLALEENMAARLDAVVAAMGDGVTPALPRPGVQPTGDYYEGDVGEGEIEQYPACALFVSSAQRISLEPTVLASRCDLAVVWWDTSTDGLPDALASRLRRIEAAARDVLMYRAPRLQSVDTPSGPSTGVLWERSTYANGDGVASVSMRFSVDIHEVV